MLVQLKGRDNISENGNMKNYWKVNNSKQRQIDRQIDREFRNNALEFIEVQPISQPNPLPKKLIIIDWEILTF